jgi:CRISPR/Cas system-associated protein Cas10 (large subunit of type III CRISPR-Cas system)
MTYYLDTLKRDDAYKTDGVFDKGKALGVVDSYIKSIKKQALAEAKAEINKEDELLGMLIKYKSINPAAKMSAEKLYKARKEKELNVSDYEIDFYDYNELFQLFKEASKIRSEGELKRKFLPKKQKEVFK